MGKIELDHTGSGGGVTLSSDGTDLLLDGTAVGGGPTFYAETFTATDPLPTANGTSCFAIGAYSQANAFGTIALGYDVQANSLNSTSIGRNSSSQGSRTGTSLGAMALGGSYASGTDSLAAAIGNNTSTYGATGANSIAMGYLSKATGTNAVSIGDTVTAFGTRSTAQGYLSTASATYSHVTGRNNVASGNYSTVWGGFLSTASGSNSSVINGFSSLAGNGYATAIGPYSMTRANYAFALGGHSFGTQGAGQSSTFNLVSDTTDATAEAMTTNKSTASTNNQVILPNNSAYAFHGTIVARQQAADGTACAAWKVEGLIRREGSAGTTVLVNSATTVLDNTPSWGMALSADTTNGGLAITVTGAASTDIRWVATIQTSEVTYA